MRAALLPFLAVCLLGGRAAAWTHGGATCPHQSAGYADGCIGAPAGQFLAPNALDSFGSASWYGYAVQSGQKWISAHPWPWDQAGVDYSIGPVQSQAASKDLNTLPTSGAVCTYQPTGGPQGGGSVSCAPFGAQTVADLEGYDFSRRGGIVLIIYSGITSTTLKNDWFKNGANTDSPGGYLVRFFGGGNVDIEDCLFDGNYPGYVPNNHPIAEIEDSRTLTNPTTMLFKYSAVINSPERPFAANAYGASRLFQYSYFDGMGLDPPPCTGSPQVCPGQHQEVLQDSEPLNVTIASIQYSFTVVRQPAFNSQGTGAALIANFANAFGTPTDQLTTIFSSFTADHLVLVGNRPPSHLPVDNIIARGIWTSVNSYGTITYNQNYIDPTGIYWAFSQEATSVGTVNWNGNNSVDMNDGLACTGSDVDYPMTDKPCGH